MNKHIVVACCCLLHPANGLLRIEKRTTGIPRSGLIVPLADFDVKGVRRVMTRPPGLGQETFKISRVGSIRVG